LDLNNIQGDILSGLPKKTQTYFFFQVTDAKLFRSQLVEFIPLVKTVAGVLLDRKAIEDHKKRGDGTLITLVGVNIAFSHLGFTQLGIDDSTLTNDPNYLTGQKKDSQALGDPGTTTGTTFTPDWNPAFLQNIHGVILVSGDSHRTVDHKLHQIKGIFGVGSQDASIKEVISLVGDVRPGKESGHEHFGFLDNISNPTVIGFDINPPPGPKSVPPGILLLGHPGDPVASRPDWAVDGSFLVIRHLFQTVPEFNTFLTNNPVTAPGLTTSTEEASELLGARIVGRWKSGAPIDLAPFKDDPVLAKDVNRRNNFQFAAEAAFQKICPFAAHVRKTNPRDDLIARGANIDNRRIMRRGIQFGPELTKEEKETGKTLKDRGLIFACYQTSINTGFAFIQESWANNPAFPPLTPQVPGLDPLIGQGGVRTLSGTPDPDDPTVLLPNLPTFITARGGEYFFSPSINGLKTTIAAA